MKYVIVDVDGTVALHVRPDGTLIRGHHEYGRVSEDVPNEPVIELVRALKHFGHRVIFVSGRMDRDDVRLDTEDWIEKHVFPSGDFTLLMRENDDYRPDDVIKEEIFNFEILPTVSHSNDILLAIDDRPRVIRMWERLGIYVIDVQPLSGEF